MTAINYRYSSTNRYLRTGNPNQPATLVSRQSGKKPAGAATAVLQ